MRFGGVPSSLGSLENGVEPSPSRPSDLRRKDHRTIKMRDGNTRTWERGSAGEPAAGEMLRGRGRGGRRAALRQRCRDSRAGPRSGKGGGRGCADSAASGAGLAHADRAGQQARAGGPLGPFLQKSWAVRASLASLLCSKYSQEC